MTRILGMVTAVILGLVALCGSLVVMAGSALTLLEGKGLAGITAWAATSRLLWRTRSRFATR